MPKKKEAGEGTFEDAFDPLDLLTKEPKTVVLMLESHEGAVVARACEALNKYAEKSAKNQIELLKLDTLESLIHLLQSRDEALRAHAVLCIATLATNREVRGALRKLGVIPLLVDLLANSLETIIQERASLSLCCLTEEYSGKASAIEHGTVPLLIPLLSSPDCDIQKNAVKCLSLIAEDYKGRPLIRTHEGFLPVLGLLDSEYPAIQKLALETLTRCCSTEVESRITLRELGAPGKLVEILQNKEFHDLHLPALLMLSYCLSDVETVTMFHGSGHLQLLVDFAKNTALVDSHQHAAVYALSCAADNDSVRKNLHEMNIEELLVSLMTSNNAEVAKASLEASVRMAKNAQAKHSLAEQGGINCLVQLLTREEVELKELALMALAAMTRPESVSSSFISKLLIESGGLQPILTFLNDKNASSCFADVATCLANLAEQEYLRSALIEQETVIPGLVALLQSSDFAVQKQTTLALASLFTDSRARKQFRVHSGIGPLLALLYSGKFEVRRNASRAVFGCSADTLLASHICSQGGIERLQELIEKAEWSWEASCFGVALKSCLDNCLPAKYWLEGRLAPSDVIEDGFYDLGQACLGKTFMPLEDAYKMELSHLIKTILLVNGGKDEGGGNPAGEGATAARPGSEMDFKPSQDTKERNSKMKGRKKKEKENVAQVPSKGDHGHMAQGTGAGVAELDQAESAWHPPSDPGFKASLDDVKKSVGLLEEEKEQIRVLAMFVCEAMGGALAGERSFKSEMLVLCSDTLVKKELECNIVPIGRVTMGVSRHRALLFKALADRLAIGCSLVRGKFGRTYNEVFFSEVNQEGQLLKPQPYVVDLLYEPGRIMLDHTRQAEEYKN
eukprot:m.235649 g.235649  ORF g.235649 m.235649 type:complete len:852 (+) comp40128_c0_seq52:35-2590(+)